MGMSFDNIERVSCDSRMRYFIFNTSSKGKRSSKGSNFYGYYSKLGNNRVGKYSKDRHNITTLYISICLYILIIEDYKRHNGWLVSLALGQLNGYFVLGIFILNAVIVKATIGSV